jgi:hypothetical protein
MRIAIAGLLMMMLCSNNPAIAEEPLPLDNDVDVLARGPVHEAFAEPVSTKCDQPEVIAKQPPAPIDEAPPQEMPDGENVQWIPGYWAWQDNTNGFIWVTGCWRQPPPGRRWLPGHWQEVEGGWVWIAGAWIPADQQSLLYLPPPPPSEEKGPTTDAPGDDNIYMPGTWVYEDSRYLWQPGYWTKFNPNWVWQPSIFVWTTSGCLYVPGYWDYPLTERGLLFAPVQFTEAWLRRPRAFVPVYTVLEDFLLGALFIGPHRHSYYFGDYFEDQFLKHGFVAWPDYHREHKTYDPIFAYYRHRHGVDASWEKGLRDLYAARRSGDVPRPPHSWKAQAEALQKLARDKDEKGVVRKDINITHLQNQSALLPLKERANYKVSELGSLHQKETKIPERLLKVQPVPKDLHAEQLKTAQQHRDAQQVRHDTESKLLDQGGVPFRHTDKPNTAKVELPKLPPTVTKPPTQPHQPPPHPELPKHEEVTIPKYDPKVPPGPPKKK